METLRAIVDASKVTSSLGKRDSDMREECVQVTRKEVAMHNKSSDLWCVIDGVVYDLTHFRHEHPGGEKGECAFVTSLSMINN